MDSGFAAVGDDAVDDFFRREFGDAMPLMPSLQRDYASHPTGLLGTVTCRPWSRDKTLLIGDAAHAIVPFHGQGMNAAFEDCVVLDKLLEQRAADDAGGWPEVFADFERLRAPNTRAIAEMAIENYQEMRDEVRDAKFELRAALSFELERRFPGRFTALFDGDVPPQIPYAEAQRRVLQRRSSASSATQSNRCTRRFRPRATLVDRLL